MGVIEVLRRQERQAAAEEKSHEFVTNLIEQTDFDDTKIAELASVSVAAVRKVRRDLAKKKK